jgi:hypothetical protein
MPPVNASGTPTSHDRATAVLYHFLNGTWTRTNVAVNAPGETHLNAIAMDSPTDGWAVGEKLVFANGQIAALLLHYDGHAWRQVSNPIQSDLGAVHMLSATAGWALSVSGTDAAIYHFDGTSWMPQPVPPVSVAGQQYSLQLAGLSMVSADDGWAVGAAIPPSPVAGSPGSTSETPAGVILHSTGGTWRVQQIIPNAAIGGIAMDAPGEGWAVGDELPAQQTSSNTGPSNSAANQHMLLLHYDGTKWTEVATPNVKGRAGYVFPGYEITSFSVPASNDVWAVGSAVSTPDHFQIGPQGSGPIITNYPVIMRYHDGAWTVYSS